MSDIGEKYVKLLGFKALYGLLVVLICQICSHSISSCAGDLQSTLLAMRDSACEASAALSSYVSIVGGHSALTSECGSMLEEVCSVYRRFAPVTNIFIDFQLA